MVCLVINGKKLPAQEKLVRKLTGIDFGERAMGMDGGGRPMSIDSDGRRIVSISVNINTERNNVIMGKETRTLWGRDYIEDSIRILDSADNGANATSEVKFRISPLSFYQINPGQTERLYSLALEYASLTGNETVWDLYCGIGTISIFLAKKAKRVYGVEIVPQAIEDAKENARINGITNAEFYVGKAEEVLPDKFKKEGIHTDVIVVDPPRKGCDDKCLETMLAMQPARIVYVSCDSATLARDLRVLADGGYEVKRVRGVDQFGGTVHTECVCQLVRKGIDSSIVENAEKRRINYREEEIPDCGCIYG